MGVTRTEANRYIQLKELALAGGGSDPQLEQRVEALETSVDGDGGLIDQVDALDEQINGDSTATPPVTGIVDEIEALEVSVYGDSTTTPPTKGIVDQLTADNDQEFQFAFDSTSQKYGYKVQIGGADTFVPFSTGGVASISAIYLQKILKNSSHAETIDPAKAYIVFMCLGYTYDPAICAAASVLNGVVTMLKDNGNFSISLSGSTLTSGVVSGTADGYLIICEIS